MQGCHRETGVLVMRLLLLCLMLLMLPGCSANFAGDLFWWKRAEPRTEMPWYGSVSGESNKHGGFPTLGGEQ
jgi:hypothetical protein